MNLAGFRLSKWVSNSHKLLDSIQSEERAKEVRDMVLSQLCLPIQRTLGVHWETDEDVLGFKAQMKENAGLRRMEQEAGECYWQAWETSMHNRSPEGSTMHRGPNNSRDLQYYLCAIVKE